MDNLKNQKGFSLIEILIGIAIFAIIFIGVSYLLMDNLQASFDNQEKIKADFLVSEGLEAVKAIASHDWEQVPAGTYGLKLENNQWQLVSEPEKVSQMAKNGERIITITDLESNKIKKVDSKVVWLSITDKLKEASAATLITNWHGYVSECSDGLDNDYDGAVDYPDDPGCDSPEDDDEPDPIIIPPPPPPNCLDNDNDGYALAGQNCGPVDCDDNNNYLNPGISEICNNSIDDNCNGLIDCEDPSCAEAANCQYIPPQPTCTDSDQDGFNTVEADCGPADCNDNNAVINPEALENCTNNLDDNCNGLIDCDDQACSNSENCTDIPPEPTCTDLDKDGFNQAAEGCDEADCDDNSSNINPNAAEICGNGIDDNCNGLIDCADQFCSDDATCQPVTPDVIFDDEDTPLCQYDAGTVNVTGKVILSPGQTARLQLSYYIVWPADLRTDITYVDQGLVNNNDTFSIGVPWPGIRPQDDKVEIHIGAMLLNPATGDPIMSNGSSLDYYWYPWVCPPPPINPECSDGLDNDNDGNIDYPEDPGCILPDDDDEDDECGQESDNNYDYTCNNDDDDDEIEIKIKNNNNRGFSDATISLPPGVIPLLPKAGEVYQGLLGTYSVEITNNPFYGIKFNTIGSNGFKNGGEEVFVITLSPEDYAKIEEVKVQSKSALIIGKVIFTF